MKKKRLIKLLAAAVSAVLLVGCCFACNSNKKEPQEPWEQEYSYYVPLKMNAEKKLKVFNNFKVEKLTDDELLLATAIQGLFARDEVVYYNGGPESATQVWLDNLIDNYGVTVEYVQLADMVQAYVDKFGTNAGYALCDITTDSINAATNACSATGALPATGATRALLESYYLAKQYDFTRTPNGYYSTEEYSFRLFKDKLNNKRLYSLEIPCITSRDYAIACKDYCYLYTDTVTEAAQKYIADVYDWVEDDAPVIGWGGIDEETDVARHSKNGLFTVANSHGINQTVHACPEFYGADDIKQKTDWPDRPEDEKNAHYVCIVMSDGDNIACVTTLFAQYEFYYKHKAGSFPMGFNISPSLVEMGAGVLKYCYDLVGPTDFFVGGVSGQGYMNPCEYSALDRFCSRMSHYLTRADLNVVQLLDYSIDRNRLATYAKVSALKGGQIMLGSYYEQGYGSVYWVNDKPFVTCRVSLWQGSRTGRNAEAAAARINSFSTDVTSPEAYTLVNVHPWSIFGENFSDTYYEVQRMVSLLNENVHVVTSDQFFDLMIKNVPHEDYIMYK